MHNTLDLVGKKFSRLTVIRRLENVIGSRSRREVFSKWECRCDCGNIVEKLGTNLVRGRVKSCGCYTKECCIKNGKLKRIGTKDISGAFWSRILAGARKRKLEVSISWDYAQELIEKQNFRCAISNTPIVLKASNNAYNGSTKDNTASLDRIDSSKGYIPGNIQIVHKQVNFMKQSMSHDDFINFCKVISSRF